MTLWASVVGISKSPTTLRTKTVTQLTMLSTGRGSDRLYVKRLSICTCLLPTCLLYTCLLHTYLLIPNYLYLLTGNTDTILVITRTLQLPTARPASTLKRLAWCIVLSAVHSSQHWFQSSTITKLKHFNSEILNMAEP